MIIIWWYDYDRCLSNQIVKNLNRGYLRSVSEFWFAIRKRIRHSWESKPWRPTNESRLNFFSFVRSRNLTEKRKRETWQKKKKEKENLYPCFNKIEIVHITGRNQMCSKAYIPAKFYTGSLIFFSLNGT